MTSIQFQFHNPVVHLRTIIREALAEGVPAQDLADLCGLPAGQIQSLGNPKT
jgi:hypothetical protein